MTSEWDREAERWGIERIYYDVRGQLHAASPQAIEKIAMALSDDGQLPAAPHDQSETELAYQGDGQRGWLLAMQLYSLRSQRNWGLGDFTDLAAVIEIAGAFGAAGIGLNPLHALFGDRPEDASPYAPNSRLFLNPLYIDVEAIPHFPRAYVVSIADQLQALRNVELVDYRAVAELKWPALRAAHRSFRANASAQERAEFLGFCNDHDPALMHFAAFETVRQKFGGVWWEWPTVWRRPNQEAIQELESEEGEEFEFHRFVQWIADTQLGACSGLAKSCGMSVGLFIDVAVGIDASGADAWLTQEATLQRLSVGAPPDEFNTAGQDWGLTSFNPHGLVRQNFKPFRNMLRAAMRHAGAIRIDHVLGLMRLYVIPFGSKPQDGAYIRFPFAVMLNVVAEQSRHSRCLVIGEDLGTVPEGFRSTMHKWGLWSYLVMLFEREWDGSFKRPQDYYPNALATFGTHDLPTFSSWMSGHDLVTKQTIGVDPGESALDRERSRTALQQSIGEPADFLKVVEFLGATPTRLVSIAIEDVLGLRDQINVPGTVLQHPNWRRRLPIDLIALRKDHRLREIAVAFKRSGRTNV